MTPRKARFFGVLALLAGLVPASLASAAGTHALGSDMMAGAGAALISDGPTDAFGTAPVAQQFFFAQVRGGTADRSDETVTGGHLGWRWSLRLGQTNTTSGSAPGGLGGVGQVEGAARLYTFNIPFEGALVVHGGAEVGRIHRWWTPNWYGTVLVGAGLQMAPLSFARLELDYTWAPVSVQSQDKPDHDVGRSEHRVSAGLAIGPIGVGAKFVMMSAQQTYRASTQGTSTGQRLEAFAEWRM